MNLEECEDLPKKLIRYTAHTYETVILKDEKWEDLFSNDPYIIKNPTISAVSLPIIINSVFSGVIYLEINKNAEELSSDKLETIKALSCHVLLKKKLQNLMEKENTGNGITTQMVELLTIRELEILRLIARGESNGEIATNLGLTINTVKTHVLGIYGKLGVNRRAQAAILARDLNIS